MKDNQNADVLRYLKTHKSLTALRAQTALGVGRLGARIYDLREMGHKILTIMINVRNRRGKVCRVAKYVLG